MTDANTNIALFGLIGALVGAVPGILSVLITWLKGRDAVSRSLKNIELAKAEVEFISIWLDTVSGLVVDESLETRKEAARSRLDRLMQLTAESIEERLDESTQHKGTPVKTSKDLWFYVYSGFFFFVIFGAGIDEKDEFSIPHLISEVTGDGALPMLVLGSIWAFLFVRFILSRVAKQAEK